MAVNPPHKTKTDVITRRHGPPEIRTYRLAA
jgi:hypothetical protein